MELPFEEIAVTTMAECYARRNILFVGFVAISLTFLILGTVWPKRYTSSITIHMDQTNILQPLMRGAAETTVAIDHAANAREIIFGERILGEVLEGAGWLKTNPSEVEQERIKQQIKQKIVVSTVGENLIKIQYTDSLPMRTYITANQLGNLFINAGESGKIEESQNAYNFIEKQVYEYLGKLTRAEEQLREFRSNNPDARPGMGTEVSGRIGTLQSSIEQTRLQIREATIRRDSIRDQLSGEAAITISQSREGQYRSKIAELQTQLETLRLDYNDTYPDIVRIKHQIDDLKQSMVQEAQRRDEARSHANKSGGTYIDENIILSPLYQQLRSDASTTETEIATLNARIAETQKILDNEYARTRRMHDGEAALTKLMRDYQVNQEIYQDLLRRKENAHVSRNVDQENQGLTFKIQEPANMPLLPTGIRFLHFAMAGLILGIVVPVSLVYVLVQFDPRVRFSKVISTDLELPVLADIAMISTASELQKEKSDLKKLSVGVGLVLVVYVIVGWIMFTGNV